ncbi:hypothetical protein [Nocardioides sp. MH1]|uniref:hypothetical protein n=1 Tax=Nocardioides sp. MH1 TaxID=3242490 RepID=UPI003520A4E6
MTQSQSTQTMKPGWYRCSDLVNTIGFWDGQKWTGEYQAYFPTPPTTVSTIAWGVFWGMVLFLVIPGLLLFLVAGLGTVAIRS